MGAILSAIAAPLLSALQSVLGPLLAYFTGRAQGRAAMAAEQTAAVAEVIAAEQKAAAEAPRTHDGVIGLLRDDGRPF